VPSPVLRGDELYLKVDDLSTVENMGAGRRPWEAQAFFQPARLERQLRVRKMFPARTTICLRRSWDACGTSARHNNRNYEDMSAVVICSRGRRGAHWPRRAR